MRNSFSGREGDGGRIVFYFVVSLRSDEVMVSCNYSETLVKWIERDDTWFLDGRGQERSCTNLDSKCATSIL